MANSTLDRIAIEFSKAIESISEAVSSNTAFETFMGELGWDIQVIPNPIQNLGTAITDLQAKLAPILDESATIQDWDNLRTSIKTLVELIADLQNEDFSSYNTLTNDNFVNIFPKQLVDYLLIRYLRSYQPVFFQIFRVLGVINSTYQPASGSRTDYIKDEIIWSNLPLALSNTESLLAQVYGWGTMNFNTSDFLTRVQSLLNYLGVPAYVKLINPSEMSSLENGAIEDGNPSRFQLNIPIFNAGSPSAAAEAGVVISPLPAVSSSLPGLALLPYINGAVSVNYQITPNLLFNFASNLSVQGGIAAVKRPNEEIKIYTGYQDPSSTVQANGGLEMSLVNSNANGNPTLIIGSEGGSRIEYQVLSIESGLNFTSAGIGEIFIEFELVGGKAVISSGSADSFIKKLFPKNGVEADFQLTFGLSSVKGFYFKGAGGLEIFIPAHFTLGPLEFNGFKIAAVPANGTIPVKVGTDIKLQLGPFTAVVQDIGLQAIFDFPGSGNLGPVDLDLGFKPPKGLGLTMKGETVSGGGFLSFNKDEGRYVGALELSIKDKIAIKAIGILTTKLPGGQPGYSLLLLITAEFQPIQLGFGFTLNGVGGLIALHRRMNTEALRNGVRNGTIDNILFPTDPVANINSIVSSLESVFPIAEGRYSFGPMAIIGWGTPTLITAELGLFFELPDVNEIALIGVIRAILPKEDKPILKLQIAFAGIINFEKKFITFDAAIFDSSIAGMALSGDMVFRLRWGDQPTFVLSVGGFHPKFPVPPLNIPSMRRLTVNLLGGDSPRLTLSTYFAITSNTAQFGAAIDLYWSITDNIKVLGHLGYDALFYFSPFRFQATIEASLSVERKGKTLFSVWLAGLLEGPTPWHVQGAVGFKVLGIQYDKDFDKTFGQSDYTTLPDVEVWPKLEAALKDKKNWQATMSTNVPLLVTVREITTTGNQVVVHPQGTLAVSQKVVPLNINISRFGNCRPDPDGYSYFSIDISYPSQSNLPKTDLKEYFAPNEYFSLSESERLNRPSFELMTAGAQVTSTSNALTSGGYRARQYDYETTVMDSRRNPVKMMNPTHLETALLKPLSGGNASNNSPLNMPARMRGGNSSSQFSIGGNTYALAQTSNLSQYGTTTTGSYTEALALLENTLALNPALEGQLQVVNTFELN